MMSQAQIVWEIISGHCSVDTGAPMHTRQTLCAAQVLPSVSQDSRVKALGPLGALVGNLVGMERSSRGAEALGGPTVYAVSRMPLEVISLQAPLRCSWHLLEGLSNGNKWGRWLCQTRALLALSVSCIPSLLLPLDRSNKGTKLKMTQGGERGCCDGSPSSLGQGFCLRESGRLARRSQI